MNQVEFENKRASEAMAKRLNELVLASCAWALSVEAVKNLHPVLDCNRVDVVREVAAAAHVAMLEARQACQIYFDLSLDLASKKG
jgi:hypothetical protein